MRLLKFTYLLTVVVFCALVFNLLDFESAILVCVVAFLMNLFKGLVEGGELFARVHELQDTGTTLLKAQAAKIEELEAIVATFVER